MPAQDDDGGAPVWLSGVACSGEESQLSECEHSGWWVAVPNLPAVCRAWWVGGAGRTDTRRAGGQE
jgi:hypothetical protein